MRSLMSAVLIILLIAFIGLGIFYFWGSSAGTDQSGYYRILRYTDAPQVKKDTFTILTYNIGYMSGLSNNRDTSVTRDFYAANLARACQLISELAPDFAGFQEIDFNSHRSFHINQLDTLGRKAGYRFGAMAVNWDKRYVPFPYWPPSVHFGRILSGQAVLSQDDILENRVEILPKPASNPFYYNAFYLDRLIQECTIHLAGGKKLLLFNVHFEAYDPETRETDSELLLQYLSQIPDSVPYLVMGDFNSRPPYKNVTGNKENTIRKLLDYGLEPAIIESEYLKDPSSYYTFSSRAPVEMIDYIFFDPMRIVRIDAHVIRGAGEISDHFPLLMKFIIKK